MILVLFGSRSLTDEPQVFSIIDSCLARMDLSLSDIDQVISGGARGVDSIAQRWARLHGIPFGEYPAQWDVYGRSAGMRRNHEMAEVAKVGIGIWDGRSMGTLAMKEAMELRGKRVEWVVVQ